MTQNKQTKNLRQKLRSNMPKAEQILWARLKGRQLEDLKFRRQHEIAGYIVDFYCSERKLAIELDGYSHVGANNVAKDLSRQSAIEETGVRVLRFSNSQIYDNLNGVLLEILKYCEDLRIETPRDLEVLVNETGKSVS